MQRCILVAALLLYPLAVQAAEPTIGVKGGQVGTQVNGKPMARVNCCVLFDPRDRPRACFSLHQEPNGKTEYGYFIVFKPEAKPPQPRRCDNTILGGEITSMEGHLMLGQKDLRIKESFRLGIPIVVNGERQGEKFSIDGVEIGSTEPRVFLCDLTAEKPKCTPVKIALPASVPDFTDQKTWATTADKALDSLREKSPEVRNFFEP